MKNRSKRILFLLGAVSFFNYQCFTSTSLFKSARSLGSTDMGQPKTNFQAGASYSQYEPAVGQKFNLFFLDFDLQAAIIPDVMEFGGRVYLGMPQGPGLSTLASLGFVAVGVGLGAGVKFTFLDMDSFAAAFALEGTVNMPFYHMAVFPSLLFTYSLENFSVTLAPRMAWYTAATQDTSTGISISGIDTSALLYGATLTLDIGGHFGILPEVGILLPVDSNAQTLLNVTNWYVGVSVRFGK